MQSTEHTSARPPIAWIWTVVVMWSALAVGVAIHGYHYPRAHTVFDVYSLASRTWWDGEDIYARRIDYYRYSPLFAVVNSPLALLPDNWGNAVWKLFNCSIYLAGLWIWARRILPRFLTQGQIATLFLLVGPLSLHSTYNGQANLLMLGTILIGLAAIVDKRWTAAAVCIAAATLIKGYPLALAMLLGVLWPRRFALRYLAALAVGLLLPFLAQAPSFVLDQYASWHHHLVASASINLERRRSLEYLFQIAHHPLTPMVSAIAGAIAGAIVLALCLFFARRTRDLRETLTRTFQLFAVWAILFNPATEACTYVLLAPAIGWSLLDVFTRPARLASRVVLIASLLMMSLLVTDAVGPWMRSLATSYGSQPLGALVYCGYLVVQTIVVRPAVTKNRTTDASTRIAA